jgi:hypothetical protein
LNCNFAVKLSFRARRVNAGLHLVKPRFSFIFCGLNEGCRANVPAKENMNKPAKACLNWRTIASPGNQGLASR